MLAFFFFFWLLSSLFVVSHPSRKRSTARHGWSPSSELLGFTTNWCGTLKLSDTPIYLFLWSTVGFLLAPIWQFAHSFVVFLCLFPHLMRRGSLHWSDQSHRGRWHAGCFCFSHRTCSSARSTKDPALFQRLWRHWNQVGTGLFYVIFE